MSLISTFGKNVKYFRYQANLTQEKVAEKVGISDTYLSNVESGKYNLTFDKIEKLSKVLGIEPYQLFLQPKVNKFPRRVDMNK